MSICDCVDGDTRKHLIELIGVEIADPVTSVPTEKWKALKTELEQCKVSTKPRAKEDKGDGFSRSGRKLSDYQMFLGSCMRSPEKGGRGLPMMDCISEWKARKG